MSEQYRIGELSQKANVTRRTIHYYISKGLLPPAEGAGVSSYYSDEHLYRILLIKKLQDKYLPLEKIKEIITRLSLDEVIEQLDTVEEGEHDFIKHEIRSDYVIRQSLAPHTLEDSTEYIKVILGSGVELHYPKKLEAEKPGLINILVMYAKKMIKEE
ncbi:MerR family transcriptional regulator [Candidatus Contubernalis alkaliaceticus]|uniref:MerR family transcriptional regulator n=1 Tax=Candidatus Contubernalis alkaliaceticus TaxID=338645 RepID=UPI001F4BE483|nr:MerR family transcriptional regulator [Candidatus Contubernalis alkalaceticus]UNC91260.1 MerR family transcriptional regulator [Candidatus Contubernalis alkalaceticus]